MRFNIGHSPIPLALTQSLPLSNPVRLPFGLKPLLFQLLTLRTRGLLSGDTLQQHADRRFVHHLIEPMTVTLHRVLRATRLFESQ